MKFVSYVIKTTQFNPKVVTKSNYMLTGHIVNIKT